MALFRYNSIFGPVKAKHEKSWMHAQLPIYFGCSISPSSCDTNPSSPSSTVLWGGRMQKVQASKTILSLLRHVVAQVLEDSSQSGPHLESRWSGSWPAANGASLQISRAPRKKQARSSLLRKITSLPGATTPKIWKTLVSQHQTIQ